MCIYTINPSNDGVPKCPLSASRAFRIGVKSGVEMDEKQDQVL